MKNAFNQAGKEKLLSQILNPRNKNNQNKQYTAKPIATKLKNNYATHEIKMPTHIKQKQILGPKSNSNANNQIAPTTNQPGSLKQYLSNSKKTSPMNKVSLQFNSQAKNKKSIGIVSLMSSLNTPKSTHCETPKPKTQPNVQNPIVVIQDEVKKETTNNDNNKGEFIKELMAMVMCLKDNKMNDKDNNTIRNKGNNNTIKKEVTNVESNEQLIQLQKKIDAIEYNTLILSQTMLPSKDKNMALIDSTIRAETYHLYFDFMYKLLTKIKSLLTFTKGANSKAKLSNLLKETNGIKKENSICDIEDSQLNEKSSIIIPSGKAELLKDNNNNNSNQNESLFISSIHSEFYQKLMEDSFQYINSNIIFEDNFDESSIKLQQEQSKITSNNKLNQIYSKIIFCPNNIANACKKIYSTERNSNKKETIKQAYNVFDLTPIELYPENSIESNDNDENYLEQTANKIHCIQAINSTKPKCSFTEIKKPSSIYPLAKDINLKKQNNCIIF